MGTQNTWEDLIDGRFILAGSPATVREQLLSIMKELGIGILMPLFQIGSLPHHLATKSANLFAAEVLPYIRTEIERFRGSKPTAPVGAAEARV
jgi:alkanesulfonate monooxygenase SsuD/methylene tetrahydromethanopterin reductase-like flavin-dependent oxidoreductase (luciferase family)